MPELSVVVFSPDEDQSALFQVLVDSTAIAQMTHAFSSFPQSERDPLLRQVQDRKPEIILVDLAPQELAAALHAIEIFKVMCPRSTVFALGEMAQSQLIVSAMRAGAQEFLPRNATTNHLLDAFNRYVSAQRKVRSTGQRGRVFVFLNAKGGNGATTLAVNTALAFATTQGSTALLDMAPMGTSALHLNVKPSFTVMDAINSLHRLDSSLLDGFMTRHSSGLHLLAGHPGINSIPANAADLARLFDVVVNQYRFVIVDASTRLDPLATAMCDLADSVLLAVTPDLSSIWSAARVNEFFSGTPAQSKLRLVLNRYKKIGGFSESEIEDAAQIKVLWKVANQYALTNGAIERGAPLVENGRSEIARSFVELSRTLTSGQEPARGRGMLFRWIPNEVSNG